MKVRLTEQANEDMLCIWEYIASDNIEAADQLIERFTTTFKKLLQNPRMGAKLVDI